METTFCGKNCDDCTFREQLNCPGCRKGPCLSWPENCSLARCCRDKGHQTCESCTFRSGCGLLGSRDEEPEKRLRRLEIQEQRRKEMADRAPFLGKWLWLLFWLVIPSVVGSLMTNETVISLLPALELPGRIINTATLIAYALILLKLSRENGHYRTSGICSLVVVALGIPTALFPEMGPASILLALPSAGAAIAGEYHEYKAHQEITDELDPDLSENWGRLWKWYIGVFLALIGGMLVLLLIPMLGLLILLAAAIGSIVVGIRKLILLYRTAQLFRGFPDGDPA